MDNKKIISVLKLTVTLLELHEENSFKIKAIQSACLNIENSKVSFSSMNENDLKEYTELGKSIQSKIIEINTTGTTKELSELLNNTPVGLLKILEIKGLGAKKVRTLWKELNIENIDELLTACQEKRISSLKGFGEKTEEAIIESIQFIKSNAQYLRYDEAETAIDYILQSIQEIKGINKIEITGAFARKLEIIDFISFLVITEINSRTISEQLNQSEFLKQDLTSSNPYIWRGHIVNSSIKVEINISKPELYYSNLYIHNSSQAHLNWITDNGTTIFNAIYNKKFIGENELLNTIKLPYIIPELREGIIEFEHYKNNPNYSDLVIKNSDLRGVLHNHSKFSDGANSIEEMAKKCIELGYEYFGIADHSKSGNFYNGGMYEEKVIAQQREIDELNRKLFPFKIFKGIEVDILSDGKLDYDDDIMASFDYVVASIHSNLSMDIDKATARTIKAIEHPSTTILGHSCGRLLLKRPGFPLDYEKIFDACVANEVGIEINANPMRLDLDWRLVIRAIEKNIVISINPDAHHINGILDTRYGVNVARKAGLTKEMTLNAMNQIDINNYFQKRKKLKGLI